MKLCSYILEYNYNVIPEDFPEYTPPAIYFTKITLNIQTTCQLEEIKVILKSTMMIIIIRRDQQGS